MNILALETSSEHASIALLTGTDVLERTLDGHSNHSERLLPSIATLLADAGLELSRLDAIAFGAGPGAFTGLRLACGVAQGLAMGADIGVVPVCGLTALALQLKAPRVLVATDARMGEIYTAAFLLRDTVPEVLRAPECIAPDRLCLPDDSGWMGIGNAFGAYADRIDPAVLGALKALRADAVARAREVAMLAVSEIEAGRTLAPEHAAPLYVRNKVALTTAERLAQGGRA